jgi:ATP-dependent Clp protease protease subunit
MKKLQKIGGVAVLAATTFVGSVLAQAKPVPLKSLPPEIQEKIRQKLKERQAAAEAAKAGEANKKPAAVTTKGKASPKSSVLATKPVRRGPALSDEVKKLRTKIQKLQADYDLKAAQQQTKFDAQRLELDRLKYEARLNAIRQELEFAKMRAEVSRIKAESELASARLRKDLAQVVEQKARVAAELGLIEQNMKLRQAQVASQLLSRKGRDQLKGVVVSEQNYPDQPFHNGTLYVSDRRIKLNGPILTGTADYVTSRIHFFNNQSAKPIFIVIDSSPGGSVQEGYRVLQAIRHSRAPVHVVVKSFAASMAAAITTLAHHSYAYPNAVILHHQMSSSMRGNITQQKEAFDRIKEWSKRLAGPIAAKMGINEEQFTKLMYKNRASGDWDEFADEAKKLKWVDNIVTEIRESGIVDRPKVASAKPRTIILPLPRRADGTEAYLDEQIDKQGKPFVQLPRLRPLDFYFIYDADGYFRY